MSKIKLFSRSYLIDRKFFLSGEKFKLAAFYIRIFSEIFRSYNLLPNICSNRTGRKKCIFFIYLNHRFRVVSMVPSFKRVL